MYELLNPLDKAKLHVVLTILLHLKASSSQRNYCFCASEEMSNNTNKNKKRTCFVLDVCLSNPARSHRLTPYNDQIYMVRICTCMSGACEHRTMAHFSQSRPETIPRFRRSKCRQTAAVDCIARVHQPQCLGFADY